MRPLARIPDQFSYIQAEGSATSSARKCVSKEYQTQHRNVLRSNTSHGLSSCHPQASFMNEGSVFHHTRDPADLHYRQTENEAVAFC